MDLILILDIYPNLHLSKFSILKTQSPIPFLFKKYNKFNIKQYKKKKKKIKFYISFLLLQEPPYQKMDCIYIYIYIYTN